MRMSDDLSAEFVRSLFYYDETTGQLIWKKKISSRQYIGDVAGCITIFGYRVVGILGKIYRAQRIVWLLKTGKWPSLFIDHINGIRSDNRWSNLREVTNAMNMQSRTKPNKHNVVGLLGVFKRKKQPKRPFVSTIDVGDKRYYLGAFATAEEAHAAYITAKKRFHPGYVWAQHGQAK